MKRPWHFWTLFIAALATVLSAMTWLTFMALDLDRAEIAARQQAELEEDISRALWRMEVTLMPILAKEAARPSSAYAPLAATDSGEKSPHHGELPTPPIELSPLLTNRSKYVLLNFEVGPANKWTSPQSLTGSLCALACRNGASIAEIQQCTHRLDALRGTVEYKTLFERLPEDSQSASTSLPFDLQATNPADPTQTLTNNRMDFNTLQLQVLQDSEPETQSPELTNTYVNRRTPSRNRNDLQQRAAALQTYSQQSIPAEQVLAVGGDTVREGVSRPVWIGSELLFARRVETHDDVRIQGCVLNWPAIKQQLLEEVDDLLPGIDIEPVSQLEQVNVSRMLAALPAQLVITNPSVPQVAWSPMRVSLWIVWACLLLVAVGAGVLLHGVLQLSERRGAFVSAVTHELRTPLTTFRMYSEMLAHDMVPDPARRRTYLETLRREADRLSHLVENVLSYARLERGPTRRGHERLTVDAMLQRMTERLVERAEQADMQLAIRIDPETRDRRLETDPAAVEQILFNLVDNACKYAAAADHRRLNLEVYESDGLLRLSVEDYGPGVAAGNVRKLFRPFSKAVDDAADSTPGVGLGLALCRRLAHELGGRLDFAPHPEGGAIFFLEFPIPDLT